MHSHEYVNPFPRCCNLLAVITWALCTDRFGRRTIINVCQTFSCAVLFTVGGLYWTGATAGNAGAGTALVRILPSSILTLY